MPRIEIRRGYVSKAECLELSTWVLSSQDQFRPGLVDLQKNRTTKRFTTRFTDEKAISYPLLVYSIRDRMRQDFNLPGPMMIDHGGRDGVVVSITHDGGDVYQHTDGLGDKALRLNILVSAPEAGGQLYVAEQPVEVNEGDLVGYLVSRHPHRVSTVLGIKPRILFMFGFYVKDWEA